MISSAARPPAAVVQAGGLSDRDRLALEFERLVWRFPGARESAILELFGVSVARYAQWVNRLVDDPAAVAYDPVGVARLRRLREQRRAARGRGL